MTARLATHSDVASRTSDVLERLLAAGVDVEFAGDGAGGADPLGAVRAGTIDLALVGIRALRGSPADDLNPIERTRHEIERLRDQVIDDLVHLLVAVILELET